MDKDTKIKKLQAENGQLKKEAALLAARYYAFCESQREQRDKAIIEDNVALDGQQGAKEGK